MKMSTDILLKLKNIVTNTNVNRWLFYLNFIMFLSFLLIWVIPSFKVYFSDFDKYKALDMLPYVRRKPITVLAHKNFPEKSSFIIGVDHSPMLFECNLTDNRVEAKLSFLDCRIDVVVTNLSAPVISKLIMINTRQLMIDENGDGKFDKIIPLGMP